MRARFRLPSEDVCGDDPKQTAHFVTSQNLRWKLPALVRTGPAFAIPRLSDFRSHGLRVRRDCDRNLPAKITGWLTVRCAMIRGMRFRRWYRNGLIGVWIKAASAPLRHAGSELRWRDIEAALGSIDDGGHAWDTDAAQWVRDQRSGDATRVG